MIASMEGFVNTVKYLLKQQNLNCKLKDNDGYDALSLATTSEIMDLFLHYFDLGMLKDLDMTTFGNTELIQAAGQGNLNTVQRLLRPGKIL